MWSPQHYRETGQKLGIDDHVVQRAATAIEDFLDQHPNLPPILTLNHLAKRTGISWYHLRQMVVGPRSNAYSFFRIRKRSGGHRQISVPEAKLMAVQRWIAIQILSKLAVHRASFAFAPKSSIKKCAQQHCGARWLIKLDISDFFGSINEIQVYRVFLKAGYAPLVAFELTRICTYAPPGNKRYDRAEWLAWRAYNKIFDYESFNIGYLPQGAPTSPMLSNLIMWDFDKKISLLATKAGLTYTRYSDDLTFSTRNDFDRTRAVALIREVAFCLRGVGLSINNSKTKIVPPGARKVVLGLLVDGSKPRLTRKFRDHLRQHVYYLEKFGPEAHRNARKFDSVSGMYRHIRGLIDFSKSIDDVFAAEMRAKFDNVQWSSDLLPLE
ncbi:reverse transcriptase domain-containing protein [Acetobacter pasteurianus]